MTWPVWLFLGLVNFSLLGSIAMNLSLIKERVNPLYGTIAGQTFLFVVICWYMFDSIPN